ncbi:MAG: type IV toxin-antitoxin system AbiEi family antitoxin domain-containing protein [Bradyrhizobium sp.]|nr:type IV toxin-antitoxin system AbiEi family antitoxin domain-containing protein [Bradyrhizobium sp.]
MDRRTPSLINQLTGKLPEGLLVDSPWLKGQGYSTQLQHSYVAAHWLEQPTRGVFRRPRGELSWQQVVVSLQMLLGESDLVVGGRTALELNGYAHYLRQETTEIHLYGPRPLPGWVGKLPLDVSFIHHTGKRLFHGGPTETMRGSHFTQVNWGLWNWPIRLSTPERAILELLDELPAKETFEQVDALFSGLGNLGPRRLQGLLEECTSIKVKRLFFFFADRHKHAWLKRLDKKAIDLGSGKRMLVRNGVLDPTYLITVPGELNGVR